MASWMKIRILSRPSPKSPIQGTGADIRILFFTHLTCYIISFYIWSFYNPDPSLHESCVDNKWLSLQRWDRAPHMTRGSPRQQQSNTSHPGPPSLLLFVTEHWLITGDRWHTNNAVQVCLLSPRQTMSDASGLLCRRIDIEHSLISEQVVRVSLLTLCGKTAINGWKYYNYLLSNY